MHTDGGGWSLVWKHSYLEVSPLTTDMYYHSDFFKPCTDLASGWCNVPDKIRFQPEEMMIAAYHYSTMVYAYKGTFNRNLDHDWTGATLLGNVRAITDRCTRSGTGVPVPKQLHDLTGMVLTKGLMVAMTVTPFSILLATLGMIVGKNVIFHHLYHPLQSMSR